MKKVPKLLTLILTLSTCFNTAAEPVNWRLQLGGMRNILRTPLDQRGGGLEYSLLLGVEVQVPLKNSWFIESGANLRFGPRTFTYMKWDILGYTAEFIPLKYFDKAGDYSGSDEYIINEYKKPGIYSNTSGFIDIPIRAGWKLPLNEKNEFQFSFGPVLTFDLTEPHVPEHGRNCFSISLSPSVVYKHRALTLGLYYQNPCIYNGSKNRETNTLMFTIGINFNGRKPNWDNVINVLETTGNVLGAASTAMSAYYESTSNSGGDTYQGSSSSSSRSSSSISGGNTGSSNRSARNSDYNTYFKNETIVIKIINGDDKVNKKSEIQRKMRSLREKWEKRGDGWNPSPYETK